MHCWRGGENVNRRPLFGPGLGREGVVREGGLQGSPGLR